MYLIRVLFLTKHSFMSSFKRLHRVVCRDGKDEASSFRRMSQ